MQELTNERLSSLAARRQASDQKMVDDAQIAEHVRTGNVDALERKIDGAKFEHNRKFAPGVTSDAQRASQGEIDNLVANLRWAKQQRAIIDNNIRERELRAEMQANPSVSRLFEVTAPDGRKLKQTALDAATLQKSLTFGYEVTGQIFASGYTVPIDGPSLFDGFIAAHGPDLLKWLSENGVTVRRGEAA
jgi:hypothetical protein